MSPAAGINQASRAELARVLRGNRFVVPAVVASTLGIDKKLAAQKLSGWTRAGWMRRVRRGLYIPVPVDVEHPGSWVEDTLVVASEVWEPCYFTGWTAASHWGLTEQSFRTTVLKTTNRVRQSSVVLLDRAYLVTHVSDVDMEWGLKSVWHEDVRLRMADSTRTIIDSLDMPRLAGGIRHAADILHSYFEQNDAEQLVEYFDHVRNHTVFKRLGFLVEQLEGDDDGVIAACQERLSAGFSLLDPDGPDTGPRSTKWRLRINATVTQDNPS